MYKISALKLISKYIIGVVMGSCVRLASCCPQAPLTRDLTALVLARSLRCILSFHVCTYAIAAFHPRWWPQGTVVGCRWASDVVEKLQAKWRLVCCYGRSKRPCIWFGLATNLRERYRHLPVLRACMLLASLRRWRKGLGQVSSLEQLDKHDYACLHHKLNFVWRWCP